MGDRSNVFIQQEQRSDGTWAGIGIYSHWGGPGLFKAVEEALPLAMKRVGDPAYFTRILVHNVLNAQFDPASETGGGLWTTMVPDNNHRVMVVNALNGRTWFVYNEDDWDLTERNDHGEGR